MSQMERPLPAAIESTLRAVGQHLSPTHENILRAALVPEPGEDGLRAALDNDNPDRLVIWQRGVGYLDEDEAYERLAALRAATPGDGLDEMTEARRVTGRHEDGSRVRPRELAAAPMEPVIWTGDGEPISGSVAAYKARHPFGPICGVVSHSGPNGEPLACAYPQNPPGERMHEHSWATLPTVAATEQGERTNSMNPHCGCSSEGHDGPCATEQGERTEPKRPDPTPLDWDH